MHCFRLIFGLGFASKPSIPDSSLVRVWASGVEFWLMYAAHGDDSMTTGHRLRLWTVCGIIEDSLMAVFLPFLALVVVISMSSWTGCSTVSGSNGSVKLSSPTKDSPSELGKAPLPWPYDSPEEDIAIEFVSSERCAPALLWDSSRV